MPLMNDRPRFEVRAPRPPRDGALQTISGTQRLIASRVSNPAYAPFWNVVTRHLAEARELDLASPHTSETARSQSAKALALSAWATGSARDAALALTAVRATGRGAWAAWPGMADVALNYVLAADVLRAMGRLRKSDFAALREGLGPKAVEGFHCAHNLPQNNWRLEADCASVAAALFFWHDPGGLNVREMLPFGLDGVSRMVFGALTPDGANEEGINYSRRGAVAVVRLAWAYWHIAGVDLLNHPMLRRWHRWQVEVKRPDGKMWPLDDGEDGYELYPHALLAHPHYRDAGLQRWAHDRAPLGKDEWAAEAMFLFDHTVRPKRPTWKPSYVLKDSGTALFRTGWDRDATMAILVARPLCAFGSDQINTAHKHDDPTNFLLHSRGELLVTEGGYGGNYLAADRFDYFLAGIAHNMVLVDGHGPLRRTSHNSDSRMGNTSQSAGRVVELCNSPGLFGAQAITSYHDVDFRRSMFMVRRRYFVIVDEVESAREREYAWVLHGNSMDIATVHPDGQRWNVGAARLCAYHLLPTAMPWRHSKGAMTIHKSAQPGGQGPFHRTTGEHMYSRVWTAGRNMTFLTVLAPDKADAPLPHVRLESAAPPAVRVRLDGMRKDDLFIWNPAGRGRVRLGAMGTFELKGTAGVFSIS